jgi:hypothetical protein
LQHAASLLYQHRRFLDSDKFTRRYMTWLGHHEFGATHRPFRFQQTSISSNASPDSIDYWLVQWINCYRYLNRILDAKVHNAWFVPYEQLCAEPTLWTRIAERIGLQPAKSATFTLHEREVVEKVDEDLLASAESLYATITRSVQQQLEDNSNQFAPPN